MDHQIKALLNAKDEQIRLQEVQIELLKDMAEQRRLALTHQSRELAEHRQWEAAHKNPVGFFFFCFLRDVWPFKLIWKYKY